MLKMCWNFFTLDTLLQVVLQEGQAQEEGSAIAHDLMIKLCIDTNNLMTCSYMEEILRKQAKK